jgi:hypothetical protein
MRMHIVMQVLGQIMARFITAYSWTIAQLLLLASKLRVSITQAYQNVPSILNLFAQIKQSIKHWLVQFTNQVLLIKVGFIHVLHKAGDLGQQLLTIARKTLQRVSQLLKQGN